MLWLEALFAVYHYVLFSFSFSFYLFSFSLFNLTVVANRNMNGNVRIPELSSTLLLLSNIQPVRPTSFFSPILPSSSSSSSPHPFPHPCPLLPSSPPPLLPSSPPPLLPSFPPSLLPSFPPPLLPSPPPLPSSPPFPSPPSLHLLPPPPLIVPTVYLDPLNKRQSFSIDMYRRCRRSQILHFERNNVYFSTKELKLIACYEKERVRTFNNITEKLTKFYTVKIMLVM